MLNISLKISFKLAVPALVLWFYTQSSLNAQVVQWVTFEALEDSLELKPQKVLIDFYADWCQYCKKMDRVVFTKDKIINVLNEKYYAVRFDIESRDTIVFNGRTYTNKSFGLTRKPVHEIALLFGSVDLENFILPLIVVLNKNFEIESRYSRYIDPKEMEKILEN